MSSFIFNSFKERFLRGDVLSRDTWKFIPVNKRFKDTFENEEVKLEYFRSIQDFRDFSSEFENTIMSGFEVENTWFRADDITLKNKPMYISNSGENSNWELFIESEFYKTVENNLSNIHEYLNRGGFYYIRTKDELRWFANRANSGNNRIIGVLGDGIEGIIDFRIGEKESYPFEGILDGNGFSLRDITVSCSEVDNGIVGVLGKSGVVRNIKLSNSPNSDLINLKCTKKINLRHIKSDGRDINAGMLVGRNYGTVENIDASELNRFLFSGFVPEVYSVTNKKDSYNDFYTIRDKFDDGENFFYLNSFCINSPGNIVPYVGYFAEGLFAQSACEDKTISIIEDDRKPQLIEFNAKHKSYLDLGVTELEFNPFEVQVSENREMGSVGDIAFANAGNSSTYTGRNHILLFSGIFVKYDRKSFVNSFGSLLGVSEDFDYASVTDSLGYNHSKFLFSCADEKYGKNAVYVLVFRVQNFQGAWKNIVLEFEGYGFDRKFDTNEREILFYSGGLPLDNSDIFPKKARNDEDEYEFIIKNEISSKRINPSDDSKNVIVNFGLDEDYVDKIFGSGAGEGVFVVEDGDIRVYSETGVDGVVLNESLKLNYMTKDVNRNTSNSIWNDQKRQYDLYLKKPIKYLGVNSVELYYPSQSEFDGMSKKEKNLKYNNDFWDNFPHDFSSAVSEFWDNLDEYTEFKYADFDFHSEESIEDRVVNNYAGGLYSRVNPSVTNYFSLDGDVKEIIKNRHTNKDITPVENVIKYYDLKTKDRSFWMGVYKFFYDDKNTNSETDEFLLNILLINNEDFIYSPFIHSGSSDEISDSVGESVRFYMDLNSWSLDKSVSHVKDFSNLYASNPNYYGVDHEGNWTSHVTRDYGSILGSSKVFEDQNILHFNWNIMKKQWSDKTQKYEKFENWGNPFLEYENSNRYLKDRKINTTIPDYIINRPIRMHSMGQVSYNVSPIVGANYGVIQNISLRVTKSNRGNFVGFVGGVCGKQERGYVASINADVTDMFEGVLERPVMPLYSDFQSIEEFNKAMEEYNIKNREYNYEVRYKTTPIVSPKLIKNLTVIEVNPDDNKEKYYEDDVYDEFNYTNNPNYKRDKALFDSYGLVDKYTSDWFSEQEVDNDTPTADVITYKLNPIINSGGLFGRIVPSRGNNKIGENVVFGLTLENLNINYKEYKNVNSSLLNLNGYLESEDKGRVVSIHDTRGIISGLVDIETSNVGNVINEENKIKLINVSANSVDDVDISENKTAPFGFLSYKPIDINTVASLRVSMVGKSKEYNVDELNITHGLDYTIESNYKDKKLYKELRYDGLHQIFDGRFLVNQSSGGFIEDEFYGAGVLNKILEFENTFIPNGNLCYYNSKSSLNGVLPYGKVSTDGVFGSHTTFVPSFENVHYRNLGIGYDGDNKSKLLGQEFFGNHFSPNVKESLDYTIPTRFYMIKKDSISGFGISGLVVSGHVVLDYGGDIKNSLMNSNIFNKSSFQHGEDRYFYYSYNSVETAVDNFILEQTVFFGNPLNMGYYINTRDRSLTFGDSLTPSIIRENLMTNETFTSKTIKSEEGDGEFDGVLVVDSSDRTVMFIDNTEGAYFDYSTLKYNFTDDHLLGVSSDI